MCGLAGFVDTADGAVEDATAAVSQMVATLTHRGPDDEGVWVDASGTVALAHRRLSVVACVARRSSANEFTERRGLSSRSMVKSITMQKFVTNSAVTSEVRRNGAATQIQRRYSRRSIVGACAARSAEASGMFALALWDRKDARADASP